MAGRSGRGRLQPGGNLAEELLIGITAGQMQHDAAYRHGDAGGDFEEREPNATDLSGCQIGRRQLRAAQLVQQHIGET